MVACVLDLLCGVRASEYEKQPEGMIFGRDDGLGVF